MSHPLLLPVEINNKSVKNAQDKADHGVIIAERLDTPKISAGKFMVSQLIGNRDLEPKEIMKAEEI